jgi:hypothetical protein
MKVSVACLTENQRFTASGSHRLDPPRFLAAFVFGEVFERTDMVGSGAVVPCGEIARHPPSEPCVRLVTAHGSPFTRFLRDSLSGSMPA